MSSFRADHRIARRLTRERCETRARRLHLIDIENIAGGPGLAPEEYRRVWHVYRHYAVAARPGDQLVIAASGVTAKSAALALVGEPVQWRVRNGRDGADLALLEFADLDFIARRFGTLIVASGDHAFAGLALAAGTAGLATRQILGRGRSSAELWRACHTHAKLRLGAREGETLALAA